MAGTNRLWLAFCAGSGTPAIGDRPVIIWLLALALAQEAPVDTSIDDDTGVPVVDPPADSDTIAVVVDPPAEENDADAVIVIYGREDLEDARAQITASFQDLGWEADRRGDTIVFKPPQAWIGKATFLPDGRFEFSTPIIPIRGADVGASGQPGGSGARRLPGDACGPGSETKEVIVRNELHLLDGSDYPGPVDLTFSIYARQDSDVALWAETQTISLAEGRFAAPIGVVNPLNDVDWQREGYWMGLTVSGEVERARAPMQNMAFERRSSTSVGPCSVAEDEYDPFAQQATGPNGQGAVGAVASVTTGFGPSRERRYAHIRQVLDASADEVAEYRGVVQAIATQSRIGDLPEQLDALWNEGKPLYGSRRIRKMEDRRTVILEHWATRAENPAGRMVCEAIKDWLGETVAYSDHPITEAEYLHYESMRTDGLRLREH